MIGCLGPLQYRDEEIVRCFLQYGEEVNVNARDNVRGTFSKTPLIWALEEEHNSVIDLLKGDDSISLHVNSCRVQENPA